MDFSSLVMLMGIFYLIVFALSYIENVLEHRRSRNLAQTRSSSSPGEQRTPSPNELPYYDSATGRRSGPALDVRSNEQKQQKVTLISIGTSGEEKLMWPPDRSETNFECVPHGSQWICSPVDENGKQYNLDGICTANDRVVKRRNWEDSHESVPHCLHGQDKIDVPRFRQLSKESLEYDEPSHHHLNSSR